MEFASGRSGHGDGNESSAADDEGRRKGETVEVNINSLLLSKSIFEQETFYLTPNLYALSSKCLIVCCFRFGVPKT